MPKGILEQLSQEKLRAVLLHEMAHIKRGDLWVNCVQTFLQIAYFYNPLVWLANSVVRRIREQAVDEMVLVALGAEAKSYSNTLIDIAEMAFSRPALSLRLVGVVESKKALSQRIKHILHQPLPKSAKLGTAGLLAMLIIAAVLLPMSEARDKQDAKSANSLYEKAKPSNRLRIKVGPTTFKVHAVVRWDSAGKRLIEDGLGKSPTVLDLETPDYSKQAAWMDIVNVHISPAPELYDVLELRVFDHRNRRLLSPAGRGGIGYAMHGPVVNIRSIGAPLPESVDIWFRVLHNPAGGPVWRLDAKAGTAAKLDNGSLTVREIRNGQWSYSTRNGPDSGTTRINWTHQEQDGTSTVVFDFKDVKSRIAGEDGRYQICAISTDGQRSVPDFPHFIGMVSGSTQVVNFDLPAENLSRFEIRPFGGRDTFYFDDVKLPKLAERRFAPPATITVPVRGKEAEFAASDWDPVPLNVQVLSGTRASGTSSGSGVRFGRVHRREEPSANEDSTTTVVYDIRGMELNCLAVSYLDPNDKPISVRAQSSGSSGTPARQSIGYEVVAIPIEKIGAIRLSLAGSGDLSSIKPDSQTDAGSKLRIEKKLFGEISEYLKKAGADYDGLSVVVSPDLSAATCSISGVRELRGVQGNNVWTPMEGRLAVEYVGRGKWKIQGTEQLGHISLEVDTSDLLKGSGTAFNREGKFIATLPNGATVELVGLFTGPNIEEFTWWRPDGSSIPQQEYNLYKGKVIPRDIRHTDQYEFEYGYILRVTPSDGSVMVAVSVGTQGSYSHPDKDGISVNMVESDKRQREKGLEQIGDIKVMAACGPFTPKGWNRGSVMGRDNNVGLYPQSFLLDDGSTVMLSAVRPDRYKPDGGLMIDAAVNANDVDMHVLYETKEAEVHRVGSASFGGGPSLISSIERRKPMMQYTFRLQGVKQEDLQKIAVEYRRFETVTFRNVALRPKVKADVQVEGEKPDVLRVPSDKYPTIPAAVGAAKEGDTILLDTSGQSDPNVNTKKRDQYAAAVPNGATVEKTMASPVGDYALGFDGVDDFLEIHASESLKLGRDFTIQMWVKPEFHDTSAPDDSRNLLSKGGYILGHPDEKNNRTAHTYGFSLNLKPKGRSTVALDMSTANGGVYTSPIVLRYESGWLHLAIVSRREGGGASRGINYIQTGEVPYQPAPDSNIIVGRDSLAPMGRPFRGQIAELRIWNRALDAGEVEHYKTVALTGNEPNLVGCWTFEQGQGQRVRDSSRFKNDASLGSSYASEDSDPVWVRIGAEKESRKPLNAQIDAQSISDTR